MPDETKTIPKSGSTAENQTAKPWLKEWEANFAPLYAMNRQAFESWARSVTGLSSELEKFLEARLHEDATLWEKLAACKNPAEAFRARASSPPRRSPTIPRRRRSFPA